MRDKKAHLYFSFEEKRLIIESLNDLRTMLITNGRYTDCADELIYKVMKCKTKKLKIKYVQT